MLYSTVLNIYKESYNYHISTLRTFSSPPNETPYTLATILHSNPHLSQSDANGNIPNDSIELSIYSML